MERSVRAHRAATPRGGRRSVRADWSFQVEKFVAQKVAKDAIGPDWARRLHYELERVPRLLRSVDASVPDSPAEFSDEHLAALRQGMTWQKATFALHFAALKQFLRYAKNPTAEHGGLWRLPSGESSRRRWLTKDQLLRLYRHAQGRERLLIALEGFNGLRRVEVLRIRPADFLGGEDALMVRGKGRYGGKWRRIPLHPTARAAVAAAIPGILPGDPLLPISSSGADGLLRRAASRAGLDRGGNRISHHDLRRTFGRLAHDAGMDLVQLKNLFGHSSIDMTVHYIGLDTERMREGLARLQRAMAMP